MVVKTYFKQAQPKHTFLSTQHTKMAAPRLAIALSLSALTYEANIKNRFTLFKTSTLILFTVFITSSYMCLAS